jgi:hypothetical protein
MAKLCPRCNRPNADEAKRCIYCGEAIGDVPAPKPVGKPEEEPSRPENYLVVISPVKEVRPEFVKGLERLFGWDSYLVRQRLRSSSPWIARVFHDAEKAQRFVQELCGTGLEGYLVKQSGLLKLEEKLIPRGIRLTGEGMVFVFEGGEEFSFRYEDLFLVVRGRIKPEQRGILEERGRDRVSLGVLLKGDRIEGDIDFGDDPLERLRERLTKLEVKRVITTDRAPSLLSETQVMDLYLRSSHRGIRVMESEFNFSGLSEMGTDSSMLNFSVLLRHLLDSAPEAYFDDGFKKISYTMMLPEEGGAKGRGIMSGLDQGKSARRLYSSRELFSDYSSRIYLHYLRESRRESGK